jgi:hypothetical protein
MHVNIKARDQILAIIRGVNTTVPACQPQPGWRRRRGRNESSPAFCIACESINVGPVPVRTIKRSCSLRGFWLQFRFLPSAAMSDSAAA